MSFLAESSKAPSTELFGLFWFKPTDDALVAQRVPDLCWSVWYSGIASRFVFVRRYFGSVFVSTDFEEFQDGKHLVRKETDWFIDLPFAIDQRVFWAQIKYPGLCLKVDGA